MVANSNGACLLESFLKPSITLRALGIASHTGCNDRVLQLRNSLGLGLAASTSKGSLARSGTSSLDSNFALAPCVTGGLDCFLLYQNGVTNGALLAIRQTCFCTGCRSTGHNHFGMSLSSNYQLAVLGDLRPISTNVCIDVFAEVTGVVCQFARLGTTCSNCLIEVHIRCFGSAVVANHHGSAATVAVAQVVFILVHVAECPNRLGIGMVATNAGVGLQAVLGAGSSRGDFFLIIVAESLAFGCFTYRTGLGSGTGCIVPSVAGSSYNLLRYQYGTANGAMATCGLTVGGAGNFYSLIRHHGVGVLTAFLLEDDRVDHSAVTAGYGCEGHSLIDGRIHLNCGVLAVVRQSADGLSFTAIHFDLCGVVFVACHVNNNLSDLSRNSKGEGTRSRARTQLQGTVTHCVYTILVYFCRTGERQGIAVNGFGVTTDSSSRILVSRGTICTQSEFCVHLCLKQLLTHRALLQVSITVVLQVMVHHGEFGLRSQDLAANGALHAVRQAGSGTGCFITLNCLLGVICHGDLLGVAIFTLGAGIGHRTNLGAGSSLGHLAFVIVVDHGDVFGLGCIAVSAVVGLGANLGASSSLGHSTLVPSVVHHGHNLLSGQHSVTNGTLNTLG